MMNTSARAAWLLAGCAAFAAAVPTASLAAPAGAETRQPPRAADPLQANAQVPAASSPAPFARYRPHANETVQPDAWRAANEQVNRVGGWRTYAREAQAQTPTPTPTPTPTQSQVQSQVPAPAQPTPPPAAHKH